MNAIASPPNVDLTIAPELGAGGDCVVCGSRYTVFLQQVTGQRRTKNRFNQYMCLDCRSVFNPSGYRESDAQQAEDARYVEEHGDRIYRLQSQLCLEIRHRAPGIRKVCEVGSGAGHFLRACGDYGLEAVGYEINPHAARLAVEAGLDCRNELLPEGGGDFDLIASTGVMKHVERPRDLFARMVSRLAPDGYIDVSVPFLERKHWRSLWTANQWNDFSDPFFDNDVHIVHFSIEGMQEMARQFGARSSEYWVSTDVLDSSPGAYPGILFRF